ncbi:MAG: 30S ribosomal protein S6e [Candidatus Aenigmarchaeota archaeon]|nr:30S ribosomal protein S6e [Candidatus Aenigmarchaeota archaeon]
MFKIVISTKEGKSYQIEKDVPTFIGMKIGQKFDGSLIGLTGYTLKITGGSGIDGFPMRRDIPGTQRKKILTFGGVGYRPKKKNVRKRKSVRGNRISEDIVQVNVKIEEAKDGAKPIEELLGLKEEQGTQEKSEEEKTDKKDQEQKSE